MGVIIRELLKTDREAIAEMLAACGTFGAGEIQVAMELFDEGVVTGPEGNYAHFGAETGNQICGYVCVGRTPMTTATWHLYWICVHPRAQKTGTGRALQMHAETFIRERGGERVVLETSGMAGYARAREFYSDAGYREVGRMPDYYKPGDDCIIYCKELH